MVAVSTDAPSRTVTIAHGTSPQRSSGTPMTAAEVTPSTSAEQLLSSSG